MCQLVNVEVKLSTAKSILRTMKEARALSIIFIVTLYTSVINCQQEAIPGRPTWQFSAQHWKLLELRNLAVNGGHKNPDSITTYDPEMCYTDECLDAAKEYLISTNFTANPCEPSKWLNFVCNRRTQFPILDRLNQFQDLMLLSERNTIDMMNSPNLTEPSLKKAQDYFRQCVHWYSKNDPSKIDEIVKHLGTHGTWPLLTGADSPGPAFDWRSLFATMQKVLKKDVTPYIFEISSVGYNRTHVPTLFEGQRTFGIMKDEIIEVIRILSKGSRTLSITDSQLLEMEDFFANLNRAQFDKSRSKALPLQRIQDYYNSQAGIPKFDFTSFLERVYNGSGVPVSPNMLVGTDLSGIQRYIKAIEEASPRVLANVMFLQFALALLSQTTDFTNDPYIFPSLTQYQVQRKYDPEAACAAEVHSKFDYALSHEYARRFYEEENTREVKKLFEDLRKGYIWLIRQTNWVAPHTKSFLIDKANSLQPFIAFEPWIKDAGLVNDYYNDLSTAPDRDDFIDSYVTASLFTRSREMGLLHKGSPNVFNYPVGNAYAGSVSPVYSVQFNQIKIPAGGIQKPVFSHKNPGFMNYAALGSAIAHELGHQFDSVGVHTSKDGRKGDYWDWLSYELYNKWKQIIIEDYNSPGFRVEEPRGNYATTCQDHAKIIDEDIADLTGLYIAYLGYQQYLRDLRNSWKQEPKLPGLKEFSPDQLFWMKYGNGWCEHVQTLLVDPRATSKGHSPGNVRASLPIKRFRYWARAFNCPNPNIQDFY